MKTGTGAPKQAMDLSFGFDDPNFSDRTLHLEIVGDAVGKDDHPHRLRDVKLRPRHDTLNTILSAPPPRVKTIHITSLILAARSPFFRKLFSNGMRETQQKHATLRIEAIEEVSFMKLLKYMYSNTLPTTLDALLNLLVIADKFEVDSCLRDCTRALKNLPMTCESASIYLDLPPCLLVSPAVKPLIDTVKHFLRGNFYDLKESKEKVLNLPLLCFQEVISSDDLKVSSEFDVYDCVLEWVRKHYSGLEERREILKTQLLHLVRFPFMTTEELTEYILSCNDIDPVVASKIVIRSLSFKAETDSSRKRRLAAADEGSQFVKRAFIHHPVKVVELESHQQCVVYLDLTRDELFHIRCVNDSRIWSETFYLDGQQLGLSASCSTDRSKFVLALDVSESSTCSVKYDFAARRKPHQNFKSWFKGTHTFKVGESVENLHSEEWSRFADYFINGVFHVRAELTKIKEIK